MSSTPASFCRSSADIKAKKRLEVIRPKLQSLRQKLAGVRTQNDEPGEIQAIQKEIAALEAEADKLKVS